MWAVPLRAENLTVPGPEGPPPENKNGTIFVFGWGTLPIIPFSIFGRVSVRNDCEDDYLYHTDERQD